METYVINYTDGRAMSLELTEDQYLVLEEGFTYGATRMRIIGVGALDLKDIRSIIKQAPVVQEDNPSYSSELTQAEKDYQQQLRQWDKYLAEQEVEAKRYTDDADFDGSDL